MQANVLNAVQNQLAIMCNKAVHWQGECSVVHLIIGIWCPDLGQKMGTVPGAFLGVTEASHFTHIFPPPPKSLSYIFNI